MSQYFYNQYLQTKSNTMKTKTLLSLLFLSISISGFSTVWPVINSGNTFSPPTFTITLGDSVTFTLSSIQHDAREVSQTTWNSNGTTALSGGFQTAGSGGTVLPAQLTVGTHYYVCTAHASMGMKGTIVVQGSSGITENQLQENISIYPNPATDVITIKAGTAIIGLTYIIADQTGKSVLTGKLNNETTSVDISQLAAGIYLFQVDEKRKQSFNVIKN